MSDLKTRFEAAARAVQSLPRRPDNETLLKLYALCKQATLGDANGKRPGITDIAGSARYDAWERQKGTSKGDVMHVYMNLVDRLTGP